MKLIVYLLSCFIVATTFGENRYYGSNSTEAKLKFSAKADIAYKGQLLDVDDLNQNNSSDAQLVENEIYLQTQHLMGSFMTPQFIDQVGGSAVLGEEYEIYYKSFKKINQNRAVVEYDFDTKIVIDKRLFESSYEIEVPIVLPYAYDKIYKQSLIAQKELNPCTDEHYNEEGDFFYFWNPDQLGCLLANDKVLRLTGKVKSLANTKMTYPEYHKLYLKDELKISVFLGYINDIESYTHVDKKDDAYKAFHKINKNLSKLGFIIVKEKNYYQIYSDGNEGKGISFYQVWQKKVKNKLGKEQIVSVKVYLNDTNAASEDYTYWTEFVPEIQNTDIFLYDGHSGLGANLELSNFPDLKFKKNNYQLFIFNGCSSYPYYNQTYFKAKGGSKNLDLVTSGLPTYTDTISQNVMAYIHPFIRGEIESYQTYLDRVENSNAQNGTYLVGVNGDEDNIFKPH